MNHEGAVPPTHELLSLFPQVVLALPFFLFLLFYIYVLIRSERDWPLRRTLCMVTGILFAGVSVIGPMAEQAHADFVTHMIGHLFLGMLAPLLLALSAPMTLFLRALPVNPARKVSRVLRSRISAVMTHPAVAGLLNLGGLWMLYTTNLYTLMHESMFWHIFLHAHVFLAGYLFTISIIYIDPIPHRRSYLTRAVFLVMALTAHGILSKYLYSHPPGGVPKEEAEIGSMVMYYGGDFVDIILIFVLCLYWYRAANPQRNRIGTAPV